MRPSITDRGSPYQVDLAIEALHGEDRRGKVVRLSEWYGVSRQTVHAARTRAHVALTEAFAPSARPARGGRYDVSVDRGRLERTVLACTMDAGASERGVQAVVKQALNVTISVGEVHAIVREAQQRARRFNEGVRLDAVEHVALDEVFSGRQPILGGVDLESSFVFLMKRSPGRSGAEWAKALSALQPRGLEPSVVVKDAGSGLEAGVRTALPRAVRQADLFHALKVMGEVAFYLERRAYKAIAVEYKTADEPLHSVRKGVAARRGQLLRQARTRCETAMTLYDQFEALRAEATRVLQLVDTNCGTVRTSHASAAALRRIGADMLALHTKCAAAAGKYISRQADKLVVYQDRVSAALQAAAVHVGGAEAVRLAAFLWQLEQDYKAARRIGERRAVFECAVVVLAQLGALVGEGRTATLCAVASIIDRRARASSLIETINGILRRHEKAHKGIPRGFLDLFQAWHNLRTYNGGKRKGKSPYELLTRQPVADWLSALGYPPPAPLTSARKILARTGRRAPQPAASGHRPARAGQAMPLAA